MIREDSQLEDFSERLLILNSDRGLAYQILGAFMRLQKKTLSYDLKNPPNEHKLAGVEWVYWAFDNHLGLGLTPKWEELEETFNILSNWALRFENMKFVLFVPQSIDGAVQDKLFQMAPNRVVCLRCPPTYGFRDQGLFEASRAEKFLKPSNTQSIKKLIFSGDLSALAISWNSLNAMLGKSLDVPAKAFSWEAWCEVFDKYFSKNLNKTLSDRFKVFQKSPTALLFRALPEPSNLENSEFWTKFPTTLTSLDRSFQFMARSLERSPDAEWVLPAPRSP